MSVDFFSYAEAVPTQKEFAICDDHDGLPVKIEHVGDSIHQVIVISNNRDDYSFIPIDHNILLKRIDGSDDKICDAMLFTKDTLCFIEIKSWREGSWISKACKQIVATIGHFNTIHSLDKHKFKDAYICNWKKRNCLVNESRMELKHNFYQNCKAHLYISNTIFELI